MVVSEVVYGIVEGFESRVVVSKVECFEKRSAVGFVVGCDILIILEAVE